VKLNLIPEERLRFNPACGIELIEIDVIGSSALN